MGVKNIFYWSPAFRICMGCLPKYERNLLKIGLKNTYFQVFQGFPALKETVAHIQPNGQFWTVFGQNGQNRNFFKKALGTFFSHFHALTNCKVSEKSNERFSRNRITYEMKLTVNLKRLFKQRHIILVQLIYKLRKKKQN